MFNHYLFRSLLGKKTFFEFKPVIPAITSVVLKYTVFPPWKLSFFEF